MPAAGASKGPGKKLTGSEKLTEIERAEVLLKKGRLTQQQFETLVIELLPTANTEPANATTFAAAGLLQLANKKSKVTGEGAAEESCEVTGGDEQPAPAVETEPEQQEQPLAEVNPAAGDEAAAAGGGATEEPQATEKKKRTSYKWKFEAFFDCKEKAREYVKTQAHHYVLKHGKNSDIVFQCRSHVDCTHHYRIYPFPKAKQWQILCSGEHAETLAADAVRGVPQHYRREVDPLLRANWAPMAVLRFLESKYKDAADLPSTDSLQNRKKTLQRSGPKGEPGVVVEPGLVTFDPLLNEVIGPAPSDPVAGMHMEIGTGEAMMHEGMVAAGQAEGLAGIEPEGEGAAMGEPMQGLEEVTAVAGEQQPQQQPEQEQDHLWVEQTVEQAPVAAGASEVGPDLNAEVAPIADQA